MDAHLDGHEPISDMEQLLYRLDISELSFRQGQQGASQVRLLGGTRQGTRSSSD